MTVTIVFGKTSDGYLYSYDANQTNSRNGPADGATQGNAIFIGRNNNDGQYATFLGYVGYDYPAIPASDTVTAALVRAYVVNLLSPTFAQDLVWRGFAWSGSGLQVADWRNPTQIAALRNDGLVHILSGAKSQFVQASSDELLAAMRPATSMEHLVHTNYNLAGAAPTRDEAIAISSADEGGTAFDPQMVYTSVTRSTLFGVLGAQVRVSDGWCFLESNGAATPTITLRHRAAGTGTLTTIAQIPIGTGVNQFAVPGGYQALALVADPSGNLYVLGRYSQAENNLAVLAFQRGGGVTWTVKQMRSTALPTYGVSINQVVALWHANGAGQIGAFVGHIGSAGDSVVHNETQHCIIDVAPLLANNTSAAFVRGSGNSLPALGYVSPPSGYFNAWHNETGNGMDVASPGQLGGSTDQAYLFSFGGDQNLGDNRRLYEGWYILNSGSTGFQWTKLQDTGNYGRKDAAGKVRVVPVSSQASAFISTDSDAGWGLTVRIRNHTGTDSTSIGSFVITSDEVPSIPDGPAVAQTPAWDAIYNATDNKLWIYYVSALNSREIRRTSIDLTTMSMNRNEILVRTTDVGNTIQAIRVQRNASITQETLLTYATVNAGVLTTYYYVDQFNAAPTAPTLIPRANFDASVAANFDWDHNDPNGDAQANYQLEISRVSDGVVVFDSGKTASATTNRTVAGGTIANGADYRWRVKTWDPQDAESPWSTYGTFTASAGGTVSITSPATDNPLDVITDDIPISWSVLGTTQAAYRVWLYRGATLVSDTNWIASTATTATVAGMLSDQLHEIRVQVRNAAAVVTNTAVRLVTPSYSTPEQPVPSITPFPEDGYVLVSVDNPTPGAPALGIPEAGFEDGISTWQTGTGSTVGPSADAHRGTGALLLTATTGGIDPIYTRDWGNFRPIEAGKRYTARMWVKVSAQTNVSGTIDWNTAGFAYISSSSFNQVVPANEWTQIQVTGTAPANAALATYGPSMTGGVPAGRTLLLDEVTLGTASDRPEVSRNQILRRPAGTEDPFEVLGEADPDGQFRDYTATAGINYEYVVRGVA